MYNACDYSYTYHLKNMSSSEISELDFDDSNNSFSSGLSKASNWTKGRSRQRLKVPKSLKNNNYISTTVKNSHAKI